MKGNGPADRGMGLFWGRMFGQLIRGVHSIFIMSGKTSTLDKILTRLAVIIVLALALNGPAFGTSFSPIKGGKLPVINFPIPKDSSERTYLGISGEGFFKISQIKAKAVLINIFNVYCPACESTALAEMYHRIENNPDLKNYIKLIGIGAGNTVSEVELFKKIHNIPFPLFADENFRIHEALGEVGTPFLIAIKVAGDGSHEIVHTQLGGLTNATSFLSALVEVFGIKQEELPMREAISPPKALGQMMH